MKNQYKVNEGVTKPAEKFPKYEKGDILTDGENKYEVLSWDYTETGIAAYYMKGVGCKFSWGCEEADKKLHLVEQKPAETEKEAKGNEREIPISAWSEEDEHNLNSVINLVHNTKDGAWGSCVGERIESWLKSIKDRYTWKPSEEQLKSLQVVIDAGYYTSYPYTLETLYEELKKLKEK